MRSQMKWGLFFIAVGAIIPLVGFPYTLLYAVPLILIGIGLVVFTERITVYVPLMVFEK